MESIARLLSSINRCLVPKLAKNHDHSIEHVEFEIRNKNLEANFQFVVNNLRHVTKVDFENHPAAVASMLNLYKELSCDSSWNKAHAKTFSNHLNTLFKDITTVNLKLVFHKNGVFSSQLVFDKCLEDLHTKLTHHNFKMYPAQIEVYCSLLKDLKEYHVDVVPCKVFPITLLLIDDYICSNKKKGLQCCSYLLQCLKTEGFENGNYYEVIYTSLKKNLVEKDIDIIKLTHSNLLSLLKVLPDQGKKEKLDELFSHSLEQLSMEANLYKKANFYSFLSTIIQWHKDNCASRSIFKQIIYQDLDTCTNDAINGIILQPLLKCLERWIIYCWPVWKYSTDHKMLSSLFKVLYASNEDYLTKETHKIIVTLIQLCTTDEQKNISNSLQRYRELDCVEFKNRIQKIADAI